MKNTIEHTYKTNKEIDYPLLFVSIAMVGIIAIGVGFFPDTTNHYASLVFDWVTSMLGSSIQVLVLLGFFFTLFIAFSKYGNIKLGNQEPEFKILPWIFMFMVAGIGSSTLYWAIVEWIYYYQDPGLGLKPLSKEALEHSVSFSYFHWGIGAWSTYALASIIMAYHFHVRKQKGLSLSSIVLAVFKFKSKSYQNIIGRIVDLVFLTASVGALVLSLVFTVLSLGAGFQVLTGLSNNFATQAIITIVSATIFCLSSYIGVDKGIQMLSSIVGYGVAIFVIIVLFIGPTEFILNNIANSLGITISDYFRMSLSTEPYGDGVFTKSWTVFFWLWWFSYTPGVAMFATRISAGRKIREVIWAFLIASCSGCWFFFGVLESYSIHQFISGNIPILDIMNEHGGDFVVTAVIQSLPFGTLFLIIFLILMIVYLASHMDAVAYSVAATSTRNLKEGEDPSRHIKLFWCGILTLIPLAILYTNAPLQTIKTSAVLTGLPFLIILLITVYGFVKWLFDDYGKVPAHIIDTHVIKQPFDE